MKDQDYESYSIEDDEDDVVRYTMWSIVPRVMAMPMSGWERAKNNGPSPDIAVLRFLLPVCLLAGGAEFLALLYQGSAGFASLLVNAVVSFCSFFLGYYIALVFARIFLPREARNFPSSRFGRLLTMTGIATLAFFHILMMALPMFDFVIEFFPLWTIFLIYKGMKFANIKPEKAPFSMGVMCVVVICGPILVEWALSLFI